MEFTAGILGLLDEGEGVSERKPELLFQDYKVSLKLVNHHVL